MCFLAILVDTCSDFRMPPYVITVVITVLLPILSASPTGACVFWA